MNQQKVVSGIVPDVSSAMQSEPEVMRLFAVYYVGGIIIAALVFRFVRAWLKSRQDGRDRPL